MNQGKRLDYLDMAKGVGIVLMVAGHLVGSLQTIDYKMWFSPFYQFLASFHMPLFFVISGILLYVTGEEERDMSVILCRKARSLLLPYVSFSIAYLSMNTVTLIFQPQLLEPGQMWKFVIYTVTFRGISVMWFLPALFLGEVIFLWCRKRMGDVQLTALFCATGLAVMAVSPVFGWEGWESHLGLMALGAAFQTLARGLFSCTFLMIGYRTGPLLEKREGRSLPGLALGILLLAAAGFLSFLNDTVDMNYMVFNNIALYLTCACAGSFGVILVCKNIFRSRLLLFYGLNSLVIMATHMEFKVMLHSIQISYWINQFVDRAKEPVLFATMALLITLTEAVLVFVYRHYLYFLIGRRKPVKGRKEGLI